MKFSFWQSVTLVFFRWCRKLGFTENRKSREEIRTIFFLFCLCVVIECRFVFWLWKVKIYVHKFLLWRCLSCLIYLSDRKLLQNGKLGISLEWKQYQTKTLVLSINILSWILSDLWLLFFISWLSSHLKNSSLAGIRVPLASMTCWEPQRGFWEQDIENI